jgi:peroxisomal 2,4-dienoyl-CoA reductase
LQRAPAASLDRLTQTAKELSEATGQTCIPAQADVRQPPMLASAVTKAIERFGKIDFVICGESFPFALKPHHSLSLSCAGAAGNFLASIAGQSENAFKTVVEIDAVSPDPDPFGIRFPKCFSKF